MPKPTAGREYTIVSGDTLSHIAAAAYGDGTQWRRIWRANQTRLRSGDPDLIYPGEVIVIPGQAPEIEAIERELSAGSLSGKDLDDFTLIIDGAEFPVITGRVLRSLDTAADGWTATLARNFDDERQNEKLKPYQYLESLVYLGGQLAVRGALYTVAPKVSTQGITVDLEGWTFSADAIDSTIRPPYEENNVTLEQRAVNLCSALGLPVSFAGDDDAVFKRVTASPTDTIHSHLAKLATQRGYLLTSDQQGDMLITRANTTGEPVGTLVEVFHRLRISPLGSTVERGSMLIGHWRKVRKNGRVRSARSQKIRAFQKVGF